MGASVAVERWGKCGNGEEHDEAESVIGIYSEKGAETSHGKDLEGGLEGSREHREQTWGRRARGIAGLGYL